MVAVTLAVVFEEGVEEEEDAVWTVETAAVAVAVAGAPTVVAD